MALTTYPITGNLEDALGAKALLGEVTFMPAGTTEDARVDGADAMLGPIRYSIADLPSPMALTEGAWVIAIRPTGRVNGEAQFRTKTIPWNMTAATTWGAIVASAADPVPLPAPTFDESVAGVLGTGGQTDTALRETIVTETDERFGNGDLLPAQNPVYLSTASVIFIRVMDGVAYGRGATDTSLHRSTDDGDTWEQVAPAETFASAPHGIAKMGNGEVVVIADAGVHRSTGWATDPLTATWTLVATPTDDGVNTKAAFIAAVWDVYDNIVLLGEYVNPKNNARYLRLSTDYGVTFTNVFDLNTFYPGQEATTHYHGVAIDQFHTGANPRLWFTHGDGPRGVFYSDDLGGTWTQFNGGVGGAFDPADSNAMTIRATDAGMVLSTDSNAPDGMYRILRTPDAADMVLERMLHIPWPHDNGALLGFGSASWRDPATGLVWTTFRVDRVTGITKPISGIVFVSDGRRAAIAWETPETADVTGENVVPEGIGVTASGALLVAYRAPDLTYKVARLTPGGRGGLPYGELNAGNALTGKTTSRLGIGIGPKVVAKGASVHVGAGISDLSGQAAPGQVALGHSVKIGADAVGIGPSADAAQAKAVVVGSVAQVTGSNATVVGADSRAHSECVVVGRNSTTSTWLRSVIIGNNLTSTASDQVLFGGKHVEMTELAADPAAPAANAGRLFFKDNGAGKTQLCVRFNTGAVVALATEA